MKKFVIILTVIMLALPALASAAASPGSDIAVAAPINVNLATAKELTGLPGVGKVTAERIVVFREANGPFASVEELLKVKGIGKKTLAKFRDRIAVD